MKSNPFNYSLREDEAAPAAGAPTPPPNPSAETHNDPSARNALLDIDDDTAEKIDTSFMANTPLLDKDGNPRFPQHGVLANQLPITIEPLGNDRFRATFKYSLSPMVFDINSGRRLPKDEREDKQEIVGKKFVNSLQGQGWPSAGAAPPMGGDPMGGMPGVDPMGAAPGMPGAGPPMGGNMSGGMPGAGPLGGLQ